MRKLIYILFGTLIATQSHAIDIDDVQNQVFTGSCAISGCHNGSVYPNLFTGQSFSAIVGGNSFQSSKPLVDPGNINNSYLLDKLQGTGTGAQMPIGPPLSSSQIQLVSDWIAQGALEDDTPSEPDTDNDGISDSSDNCPNDANADQLDTDSDGQGDVCDSDDDGDGVADSEDACPLDPNETTDSDGDGICDNADPDNATKARAYLMTNSASLNVTRLHIINSGNGPQQFTGTLYNGDGEQLGMTETALHEGSIASQGRLVLTSAELEQIMGVETWSGPAMLEVNGSAQFDLMTKLQSPSGLISNTNCVRQDRIHNIEGTDSVNLTFIRFINIGNETLTDIRGTLTDISGNTIGTADSQLLASLGPKEQVFINRDQLADIIGSSWSGVASLNTSVPMPNLRMLNLNFVNSETFFNFSCFEDDTSGRVYLITNSNSANISETHVINTGDDTTNMTATLYSGDGNQLGNADVAIGTNIAPRARAVLSATDFETTLQSDAWSGPAMLEVSSENSFELMIRLTSPSGLVSNTNCVRQGAVHNIEGTDSADRTFVRFINQGDSTISDIRGTLYDLQGDVIGTANTQILVSLAAKGQQFVNSDEFATIFGSTWTGEATLVVTASDDTDLRLLNLNFVNSETFFNFSCYENSGNTSEVTGQEFYNSNISSQVVQSTCINCHVAGGIAQATALVYEPTSTQGHQTSNFNALQSYIDSDPNNANTVLEKVRGINHGGGVQLDTESDEYNDLVAFLGLIGGNIDSNNSNPLGEFWQGVSLASPEETLRRASLITAGRLPTTSEIATVQAGGEAALPEALRALMAGDGFHDFLVRGANDRLFTDAFISGDLFFELANLQATIFFPLGANKFFNEPPREDQQDGPTWFQEWYWGLSRAPLELIAYIVENDRSYQEVMTADYMMLNYRTNEILNSGLSFASDATHRDYLPGINNGQVVEDDQLVYQFSQDTGVQVTSWGDYVDYPHAGVLNTHSFLGRYPTTETNRNRARARWTYYHFLGIDIEKSADRTTDPDALADTNNPTLNNPACTVCHNLHDPVAGTFQNYGNEGIYRDKEGGLDSLPYTYKFPRFFDDDAEESPYVVGDTWFADMLEPGLDGNLAPNPDNSLQWLGNEIANDSRYGPASVSFWWPAIMGTDALVAPELTDTSDYAQKLAAFEEQTDFINTLGAEFAAGIDGGDPYNARDMMVEMMMSPWFRAKEIDPSATTVGTGATAADIGVRRLLTPRELEEKTTELLGWTWGNFPAARFQYDGVYTTLVDEFGIYYGGIDSNGIQTRARQLTSLMANVAEHQAVSMACPSVVVDFDRPDSERIIFDGMDQNITPATEFVQQFEVSADSEQNQETYTASGTLTTGDKTIVVTFLNDYFDDDEGDRNLIVGAMRLTDGSGNVLAEVSLSNFDSIPGATASCGGANDSGFVLWGDCFFSIPFTADASGTFRIEVDAYGDQAGPDLVQMSIGVNDENFVDGQSAGAVAIKNKLIDLHSDFLGESLTLSDEEIEASYLLLVETWQDRMSQEDNDYAWTYPNENCYFWDESQWAEGGAATTASDLNGMQYTWTSMLIYLMTDFYYLHE